MDDLLKARISLGHPVNDTNPLKALDYELIGNFVQTYCTADLIARRVINSLTHIRLGNPKPFSHKLNDKDVLDHLMACADSCVWNLELAKGICKVAEIFVLHRHLRHMFGHWAGRRIPGHDVYFFFTASLEKQKLPMEAIMFEKDDSADIRYAVMPVTHLLEEAKKLEENLQYLASISAQLEAKATQVAKTVAQDDAEGRLKLRPYKVLDSNRRQRCAGYDLPAEEPG
jgi:hypothetical protein